MCVGRSCATVAAGKLAIKKKTLNAFPKHLTWHFYELWVTVHAGWRYSCWLEQIRSHLCKHSRHKHASTCVRRGRRNPRWRPWSRTPDPTWPSWRRDCFFSRTRHAKSAFLGAYQRVDRSRQHIWKPPLHTPNTAGLALAAILRWIGDILGRPDSCVHRCSGCARSRGTSSHTDSKWVQKLSWHSTKRSCWSFRKYGVKFVIKKGSNSKTARRNVAVLSCLCPRGQNNNHLEWLRNNLIQDRTSHFPAFFPSRHTPFCTQLHKKRKKKHSLSSDNPAAEADVSYLQQLLNPQTLCWSFDLPFRGWAEAWRAPSKQAQVAVSQTHTGCSPVHDIPPSLPPPSPAHSLCLYCLLLLPPTPTPGFSKWKEPYYRARTFYAAPTSAHDSCDLRPLFFFMTTPSSL